jgi:hypothetical protein
MDIFSAQNMRLLIKDYGASEVLKEMIKALKDCADDYSDLGLKDKAIEASEMSEMLEGALTTYTIEE